MAKPIPFNSIDGDVKFKLEVVDGAEIALVDVSVSASQFRKFWPLADSLCWDEEKAEFVPRYKSSYLQNATEVTTRALLAFAAGQYYLRADQGRRDESEGVTSDESLTAMELDRENSRLDECLQNSIAREDKMAELNRQLQLRIRDLEAELASQKALREESDRSLDGSIQNANNQHKLACEAREQLAKAREEAEFYRIGMQKVATIANSKPLEDS
ncbi:tail length tape measure protein [Pseudomonas phage vB_PaeM_C1-14_Ab28]|uniref:tail length tape measure protein n=1 Tax=Pseudomonas phage vB_PaeM_C1-14_Ab28 TaxID=1548917 RepID=UPI0018C1EE05|nr:tail length tape measure protein [Pseudomonas phage vB_PaeM_C1-14_Ab28]